ncbi:multidrug transporter [Microbulbifer sp. SAOS-129_SWC]|uniref:multidrug transporter n=1 Tax=Microbulbifer sp. SAOS-129_SWC TaxID=3145235 RepID=UPI003216C1B3
MRRMPRLPLAIGIAIVVAALIIWGFIEGRKELAQERESEKPLASPSRVVATENGSEVVLDDEAQRRAGIRVARLPQAQRSARLDALATVEPARELIELRSRYVAAAAEAERQAAALEASRREYQRVKALHGDDRNLSDRALQAAEATWRGDAAALRAARAETDAVIRDARSTWGDALTAATTRETQRFLDLARGKLVLLRIALPANHQLETPPVTASVIGDDGQSRPATLIAPAPQADPRIQGPTFFYSAAAAGLLPGSVLAAQLPQGKPRAGVTIPAAAVVSWQGVRWYYAERTPGHFVRQALRDGEPVTDGWFVPGQAPLGVVTRGAQALLSEELRSQIQVGDED